MSDEAKELICQLITNKDVRFTPKQVMEHSWVSKYLKEQRKQHLA